MDLMLEADLGQLTELHDEEGKTRNPPQRFHGWYIFPTYIVRSSGGDIEKTSTDDNRWHANVISPDISNEPDAMDHFVQKIAANSYWKERPLSPAVEDFLQKL